jgi:hypothetical protein
VPCHYVTHPRQRPRCKEFANSFLAPFLFCKQLSHVYELLNYGEHGTTVDEVFYSCDVSVLITGAGGGSKNQTKKSSAKNIAQHRTSAASNLVSVRQLINNEKIGGGDAADFTASSTTSGRVRILSFYYGDCLGCRRLFEVQVVSRSRLVALVAQNVA